MEEEKIAKSVKTLYVITYSIFIVLGIFWIILGAVFIKGNKNAVEDWSFFGWFFISLGVIFIVLSVGWLVYFIKMPEYSIMYKDGKLNFRNKLICTPAELDRIEAKGGGLDGAIFSFGRIVVYSGGKKYNFRFIQDAQYVASKLYVLKNGEEAKHNSAFGNAYNPVAAVPSTPSEENTEAVAQDSASSEKGENDG